ncbi:MAG TPA: 5'-methylthioadenosine/S-adenosylhomocysteine nucleosidase [Pseudogracilibacillus sp.]|nr:5'-methylthioadenosine/S-adenosylhomocysteine nucleosidase [Pseudogracilibacillus sp.]
MKFGIIGAMDEEIELLKATMTEAKEITIANAQFIEGKLENQQVILVKSGIGKVNAAMTTAILMENFQPDYVVNTGSAGGFDEHLAVGDVVISQEVVHHDVDVTAFDYAYGQVPELPPRFAADLRLVDETAAALSTLQLPYKKGLIATGDSFLSNPDRVETIKETFPEMLAGEMEAAAIAQVCYQYKVPFVVIRALSDIAGKSSEVSFDVFLETAAKNAANMILTVLRQA